MPSIQRGSVVKRDRSWSARWYDDAGQRRAQGGFATKSTAREWLDSKVDEIEALRRGETPQGPPRATPTVSELVASFLDGHDVDPATTDKLRRQLKHATARFGDVRIDRLATAELRSWRQGLSAGNRHDVFRAFKQALRQAVTDGLLERNPGDGIKNPKRSKAERRPIQPFDSWEQVLAVADELDPRYRALLVFAVGTGLRPEEWIALERRDVDREAVTVRRVFSQGRLREGGKTEGSTRRVPLRQAVLDALDAAPRRIDSPLLFPAPRGGYIDLEAFRYREWAPALRAAGVSHRRIYDSRHTFAAFAIAAGVSLFYLARIMGTSVKQIDDTYGHLLPDSEDYLRGLLEAFDGGTFGHGMGTAQTPHVAQTRTTT